MTTDGNAAVRPALLDLQPLSPAPRRHVLIGDLR
jgi:hypothetical protein